MTFWVLVVIGTLFMILAFIQIGAYALDRHEEKMAELGYVQDENGHWHKDRS